MGVPHPDLKDQPPVNPEVARFYVDLMSILQSKVKGNLTDSENREMEDVMYHLRMRILNLQPAAAQSHGATLKA